MKFSSGTDGCIYHPVPDEKIAVRGAAGSCVQNSSQT